MHLFWVSALAVLIAYTVKGLTGFANTLVFSTIMSFFPYNLAQITPLELVLGTPSNFFIAIRERKGFRLRVVAPLAALMIAGCIPGALFLKFGNPALIKTLFGVGVTLVGLETLLIDRLKLKPNRWVLGIIGITAGVMCGMYGIGALLVAYVTRTTKSPTEFRANVCFVFILVDIFRAILYLTTGIFTAEIFLTALKLAPFMAAGMGLGTQLAGKLKPRLVSKIIMILLVLSGISLTVTNLLALL